MEVFAQAFDLVGVFAILGNDGVEAYTAYRRILPIVILGAVNLVVVIYCKTLICDSPLTNHTGETLWVIPTAHGTHNVVQDNCMAFGTFIQCVLIAGVTEGLTVHLVIPLPCQWKLTLSAGEAAGVVLLPHGLHGSSLGRNAFATEGTDICSAILLLIAVDALLGRLRLIGLHETDRWWLDQRILFQKW